MIRPFHPQWLGPRAAADALENHKKRANTLHGLNVAILYAKMGGTYSYRHVLQTVQYSTVQQLDTGCTASLPTAQSLTRVVRKEVFIISVPCLSATAIFHKTSPLTTVKVRPCPHFPTLLNGKHNTRLHFKNCSDITGSGQMRPTIWCISHMVTSTEQHHAYCLIMLYVPEATDHLQSPVVTICTTRFNIQKFSVLPTQCVYVFCVDLRTNSDYFPTQHVHSCLCDADAMCLPRRRTPDATLSSLYHHNILFSLLCPSSFPSPVNFRFTFFTTR